jgi:hypothetical protein
LKPSSGRLTVEEDFFGDLDDAALPIRLTSKIDIKRRSDNAAKECLKT